MNNNAILTALKKQIEDASNLSYVKQVFLGNRQADSITQFPTLLIEPVSEEESQEVYGKFENKLTVQIIGFINIVDPEKQIVGDANNKGILDFVNDVKQALDADYTIAGTASHIVIQNAQYSSELYPVRIFALDIEIWFRQTKGSRT